MTETGQQIGQRGQALYDQKIQLQVEQDHLDWGYVGSMEPENRQGDCIACFILGQEQV